MFITVFLECKSELAGRVSIKLEIDIYDETFIC